MTISWDCVNSCCICCTLSTWNISISPIENEVSPHGPSCWKQWGFITRIERRLQPVAGCVIWPHPEELTRGTSVRLFHCAVSVNSRHCPPRRGCAHRRAKLRFNPSSVLCCCVQPEAPCALHALSSAQTSPESICHCFSDSFLPVPLGGMRDFCCVLFIHMFPVK